MWTIFQVNKHEIKLYRTILVSSVHHICVWVAAKKQLKLLLVKSIWTIFNVCANATMRDQTTGLWVWEGINSPKYILSFLLGNQIRWNKYEELYWAYRWWMFDERWHLCLFGGGCSALSPLDPVSTGPGGLWGWADHHRAKNAATTNALPTGERTMATASHGHGWEDVIGGGSGRHSREVEWGRLRQQTADAFAFI